MSCRSTPAGSAFTTFARFAGGSNMSDVATLSAFHRLRADYNGSSEYVRGRYAEEYDAEHYAQMIARMREKVVNDQTITDARRASLLARLDAAAQADPIPDAATLYALNRIVSTTEREGLMRDRVIANHAHLTGSTVEESAARFAELENSIVRTRGAADPETYTEENRRDALQAGIGTEAGTVHAYAVLTAEANAAARAQVASAPPRIVRQVLTNPQRSTAEPGHYNYAAGVITEVGYDRRNQRLEVVYVDENGNRNEYAYRNVSSHTARRMMEGNATEEWAAQLRGSRWNQYTNEEEAARAGASPRCAVCGQFADTAHTCPADVTAPVPSFNLCYGADSTSYQDIPGFESLNRWQRARVQLPLVNAFRQAGRDGSILVEGIDTYMYLPDVNGGHGRLSGDLAVVRAPESTEVTYNTAELRCNCDAYVRNSHCPHVDAYVAAVDRRLNPPARSVAAMTPEQREARLAEAQRAAEAAAVSDWTRHEATLAEARATWQANSESSYSEDFASFERHYAAATEAMAAKDGGVAVPYLKENALGGMATRESGQAFGMEIEYEFPDTMTHGQRIEANQKIGEALKAAGLTATAEQQGYHAAARNGFQDTHTHPETGMGTWSWERDGSVSGGELVSPGMYDEPETWEKLEKAVTILREHGAVATTKAGAHVHVGTAMFNGDAAKYGELARLMTQHEDVMFRLAQNPERGSHRQGHYSLPLMETPMEGWSDISDIRRWQSGRTRVLNFGAVEGTAGDHPEFRIFDSTLNPGVMQAQIKLAVAMTHAAARNAETAPTSRAKENLGAHAERAKARGRRRMTREEIAEDTATFRSFMDTLFTRDTDKAQLTALFAATKWNKASRQNLNARHDRYSRERQAATAEQS